MLKLELRTHRWVQIKKSDVPMYEEKHNVLPQLGYYYVDKVTNEPMAEFHVDTCQAFQDLVKEKEFGGNLSVRFPEGKQAIIILGHDECIFKQYHFTNKLWVADDKTRPIIPKDEGAGLMISAFQSQEFGFGHPLTPDQLKK